MFYHHINILSSGVSLQYRHFISEEIVPLYHFAVLLPQGDKAKETLVQEFGSIMHTRALPCPPKERDQINSEQTPGEKVQPFPGP